MTPITSILFFILMIAIAICLCIYFSSNEYLRLRVISAQNEAQRANEKAALLLEQYNRSSKK
jgi:hypothetical protein